MDLDDDLLALVGDSAAPASTQPSAPSPDQDSGNKRKRPRDDSSICSPRRSRSGSDMDESDSSDGGSDAAGEDDDDRQEQDFVSPFPYQTLFKDKADKAYIMGLNEFERESILAERQDEVQKQKDRIQVRRMATQLSGAAGGDAAGGLAGDDASGLRGKSERKKTQTGKSESKSSKLDELKRKRESKKRREAGDYDSDEDYGAKPAARPSRRYSPQYSDDDDDDDNEQQDSDDDQISRPAARRAGGKKGQAVDDFADELTIRGIFLQRRQCMDHWWKPWFADMVKDTYVRVLVGPDPENPGENKYRLAVVTGVVTPFTAAELQEREQAIEKVAAEAAEDANSDMEASDSDNDEGSGAKSKKKTANNAAQRKLEQVQADLAKEKKRRAFQPYRTESGELCDVMLEGKHGDAAKLFTLGELSNQPFTKREFQRLLATLHADNRKLPLKEDANAKRQQVKRYLESVKSEADIDAAIRKKKLLNDPKHIIFIKTMCRDATSDERQRQRFEAEIQKLSARLPASATIGSPAAAAAAATGTPQSASTSVSNAAATPSGATSGDHSPSKRSLTADPGRLSSAALAALRERNRKANREEIRRAEIEARRKSQTSSKVDPSARVRTTVKVLHDMRASTPDPNQTVSFEAPTNATDSQTAQFKAVVAESMSRPKTGPTKLEERAQTLDVDLGDF